MEIDPNVGVMVIFGLVLTWAALAYLGGYVSEQKGRSQGEGVFLALIFGPFGVIVAALLPNVEKVPAVLPSPATMAYMPQAKKQSPVAAPQPPPSPAPKVSPKVAVKPPPLPPKPKPVPITDEDYGIDDDKTFEFLGDLQNKAKPKRKP